VSPSKDYNKIIIIKKIILIIIITTGKIKKNISRYLY